MDQSKILNTDYLDILFEGRNKSYGGYELRRKYPKRARIAGAIIVGAAMLIMAYAYIHNMMNDDNREIGRPVMKEVVLAEPPPVDPTKPPPPPPPAEPPPPVKPTVKFTPPVIKKDEEVREEEKPATVEDLKDKVAGPTTKEGDPMGIDPGIVDVPNPGKGPVEAPAPPQIFKYVEQMPEFPGDVNSYLGNNLRYPESARESGEEGRTIIQFVVSENGEISDVTVVKSSGHSSLDAEAKRVVGKMPKWKPGKQNGKAVKVYFTLPVTFRLD